MKDAYFATAMSVLVLCIFILTTENGQKLLEWFVTWIAK